MRISLLLLPLLFFAATTVARSASHPFSVHDMLAMDRISDPQLSPDGKWILFARRVTDLEANKGVTHLWRVSIDGHQLRRVTTGPGSDQNPRWSPDGRTVWFLSSRSESTQAWRVPAEGGEPEQVTHFPLDLTSLTLSPDGERVAFSAEVFPDLATLQETRDRLDRIEAHPASGRIYDRLFVRHWDSWKDGRRAHLFVWTPGADAPLDLMRGMDADCPTKPFGGPEDYTFTPDGQGLVFSARDAGREEPWSTDFDLYFVPADGSAAPRKLTRKNRAWDSHPVFSPDGKSLAYLAMGRPGFEADRNRIVVQAWPDGKARVLTERWDRSPGGLAWSSDGKTIYASAPNLGQKSLFAVDASSGEARTLVEQGTVRWMTESEGRVLFAQEDLRSPTELYSVDSAGGDRETITRINAAQVASARMGEPEQFTFEGWNGETVHAYVVKPVDFDPNRTYPVAFLIHGGPQGSFGNSFHYRWNPQAYSGAGFATVAVDFHGSIGYGQAFTDSITGDWGGKPLEDLKKGLAAALERYPWMDGDRVCALGASYGGYMVNWIAGNWPDRFRCLVNHDGNLDERMAYFDTEELWFPEWEHGGTPWENPAGYAKHNPVDHVEKWKTPMLVVHGALDYRVVDTQGLSTFTALQRKGIPSKLLYFPDENHWVLKPHNSIQWHETVLDWIRHWTSGD